MRQYLNHEHLKAAFPCLVLISVIRIQTDKYSTYASQRFNLPIEIKKQDRMNNGFYQIFLLISSFIYQEKA